MKSVTVTHSPEETMDVAYNLAPVAEKRRYVCLTGTLGAGKTVFTSGLVQALCPECLELEHSPTFAIVNEYLGKNQNVFHFDLYRIRSADDLYSTGFFDYEERRGVIVAEWSDLFAECFPPESVFVKIETTGENERTVTVEYKD
ncbi:MAG: tRNA (adenosine(37)-N6)-threonylcarbamoyltransferase complex ATPase subunit type 1 TsaE [Clostridia bacterium]|nr:tRNA (adenosine(37)-N6)-threonylcarbamoyltransferase complex ATPase subunit type 1 TsaE [Clostridia bacterium]